MSQMLWRQVCKATKITLMPNVRRKEALGCTQGNAMCSQSTLVVVRLHGTKRYALRYETCRQEIHSSRKPHGALLVARFIVAVCIKQKRSMPCLVARQANGAQWKGKMNVPADAGTWTGPDRIARVKKMHWELSWDEVWMRGD